MIPTVNLDDRTFDDIRDDNFSIMANGYVAMSMRFPASIIALPVLDFILD